MTYNNRLLHICTTKEVRHYKHQFQSLEEVCQCCDSVYKHGNLLCPVVDHISPWRSVKSPCSTMTSVYRVLFTFAYTVTVQTPAFQH